MASATPSSPQTPKVRPFLWFHEGAHDAARYYASVFPGSRVLSLGEGIVATVEIAGQPVMLLDGGDHYTLTPAFSFYVNCADQAEVDALWDRLIGDGGTPSRCGWLTDKYGVSWQIVPEELQTLLGADDDAAATRARDAMFAMSKIDIAAMRSAFHAASEPARTER